MMFQNGMGTEFSCLKCRQNLKSNNLTKRKTIPYMGFWLGPQKKNPNFRKILNQETLSHYSIVLML
jgi:hypothetical protein